jgi:hypothetical protein
VCRTSIVGRIAVAVIVAALVVDDVDVVSMESGVADR